MTATIFGPAGSNRPTGGTANQFVSLGVLLPGFGYCVHVNVYTTTAYQSSKIVLC